MIRLVLFLHVSDEFRPAAGAANTGAESSCWAEGWEAARQTCCGPPPDLTCFNWVLTAELCCAEGPADHCLPLDRSQLVPFHSFSVGLSLPLIHASANVVGCRGIGWQPYYVVLQVGEFVVTSAGVTEIAASVVSPGATASRRHELQLPLRRLVVCAPPSCEGDVPSIGALAKFLAEETLPVLLRPGRLLRPQVLRAEALADVEERISAARRSANTSDRALGVSCRSGGCAFLPLSSHGGRAVDALPSHALLAIDVGAHNQTEFMSWLDAEGDVGRRYVIAVEPDPQLVRAHRTHPRFALLEAAVGEPSATGRASLHRSHFDMCNSLMPLGDGMAHAAHHGFSKFVAECMTPSKLGPVEVQVVSLASILRILPTGMQVSFLKVDAQGGDLAVLRSAGEDLHRVRRLQVEVQDLPHGDPRMLYGVAQPNKQDVIDYLAQHGFVLDFCSPNTEEVKEENCLFVRADLISDPPAESQGDFISFPSFRFAL